VCKIYIHIYRKSLLIFQLITQILIYISIAPTCVHTYIYIHIYICIRNHCWLFNSLLLIFIRSIAPTCVVIFEFWISPAIDCFCYGYCATAQGSLDWFEVDLSAHPASSSRVICQKNCFWISPATDCTEREGGLRNNVSKVSHLLNTLYSKSNSHVKSNSPYKIDRLSRRTFLKVRSLLKSEYKKTIKLTFEKFFQRLLLHILRVGSKDMARVLALFRIIRCPHTIRCPLILQVLLFLFLYMYTTIFLLQPLYHIPRCRHSSV